MMARSAVLCALGATVGLAGQQQQPTFGTSTHAVTVSASVQARNRPVQGLGAADFLVTDNGVAQHVTVSPARASLWT